MLSTKVNRIGVYEPIAMKILEKIYPISEMLNLNPPYLQRYLANMTAIVATEYEEFLEINVRDFLNLKDKTVFDGRNIWIKRNLKDRHSIYWSRYLRAKKFNLSLGISFNKILFNLN